MASISPLARTSQQVIPNQQIPSKVFLSEDGLDQPCDIITLVVNDCALKAHRKVLAEASPFFEKLLDSDMKESNEGVVRLEMFTESVMRKTLGFIYTGNVQILNEDDARDMVVIADYLFLLNLKTLAAQALQQKLNASNCIPIFRFAYEYRCEDLVSKAKNFLLANFTELFAANREDVLEMSSEELIMLISSDELPVKVEKDVFDIILAWINHDRNMRKNCFTELFRHVRLVCISRDSLCSDIVTNDLVTDNECCLELVKEAIELIDSTKVFKSVLCKPRKSLEASAIVANIGYRLMLYFPREDRWYEKMPWPLLISGDINGVLFCHDKIYYTSRKEVGEIYTMGSSERTPISFGESCSLHINCYIPHSETWKSLPSLNDGLLREIFVYNDATYAVRSPCLSPCAKACGYNFRMRSGIIVIKYNTESNSWEDISSPEFLVNREHYCIVTHDNFIYFIGGTEWSRNTPGGERLLREVDRFDLRRNQWDKLADIQVAREGSGHGAAANGKIFIAGNVHYRMETDDHLCEMYNETTNEWQFIKSFNIEPEKFGGLFVVDEKLYALGEIRSWYSDRGGERSGRLKVECYNAESDEWKLKTEVAVSLRRFQFASYGTMKLFQGFLSPYSFDCSSCSVGPASQDTLHQGRDEGKCSVM